MLNGFEQPSESENPSFAAKIESIFDDFEGRSNIVDLFDLMYHIDRRINSNLYESEDSSANPCRETDYD